MFRVDQHGETVKGGNFGVDEHVLTMTLFQTEFGVNGYLYVVKDTIIELIEFMSVGIVQLIVLDVNV